ncbi:hypothetical protein [Fibrella forsythiae]|uniref:Uncharacterized protein n=1 Tax=Fibrella forsythiae TaxID=2817061 RepID=A0ABS3JBX2_9BACT|nr:hypothetical protein [Fibrella forsythiae]MBO0947475.1 hypothetical protein [Fibrella forsythiae]
MKKLIGILYSAPMVLALLADLKTQTRRITGKLKLINENLSYDWKLSTERVILRDAKTKQERWRTVYHFNATGINTIAMFCPYGEPGDVLWVRETFAQCIERQAPVTYPDDYIYRADEGNHDWPHGWSPSLHMPYVACRIWLEVVSVRIERLQEISEADAIAEGIASTPVTIACSGSSVEYRYQNYLQRHDINHPLHRWTHTARHSYQTLWAKLNGRDSWAANPYVWVVEFKRIEEPANND